MAVFVRILQENEIELANNFFNQIYNTNRPIENFKWEFLQGPSGKAIYIVAIDDTSESVKIVGIQCAIPIELIGSNGSVVLTAKSEDTLVDPAYRGQKIFERMYDLLFAECRKVGIKYIWGFTPAQKAFERIGFEIPFKTEQALFVSKPIGAYRYLKSLNTSNTTKDKLKIFGLSVLAYFKGLLNIFSKAATTQKTNIQSTNNLFLNFYKTENLFTLNESDAYLDWRINKNPFRNQYSQHQWISEGKTLADAIINVREGVSYIEQLYFNHSTSPVPFIQSLIQELKKNKTPLIRAFCFSSNKTQIQQGEALKQAGFTYLKRGNYFVWKSLDETNTIKPEQLLITRLFTQGNV